MTAHPAADAATLKACCATGYSSDVVALLLGPSYHPGGLRLTRRLLDTIEAGPGDRLVDVASGIGTTSLLAAQEYGADVDGVDLSAANVALASGAAQSLGLSGRARFHHGDAEALPLPDAAYDAVVCECALCTFPDKVTAAAEMARVLRPGGRVGLTDITADPRRLPPELTGIAAWVACVADARPVEEYRSILAGAGLRVTAVERHTDALEQLVRQVGARLELVRMTSPGRLEELGIDLTRAGPVLAMVQAAIRDGVLDYVLLVGEKR
ncbi:MAG: methyltransferase domain-containing protein [Nocardioides sp.]